MTFFGLIKLRIDTFGSVNLCLKQMDSFPGSHANDVCGFEFSIGLPLP